MTNQTLTRRHDEGTIRIVAHCSGSERFVESIPESKDVYYDPILKDVFNQVMLSVDDYGLWSFMRRHPSIETLYVYSRGQLFVELHNSGSKNTPIEDLLRQYEAECCDHSNLEWVVKAAGRYVETMEDCQVRCLLHVLAREVEKTLSA